MSPHAETALDQLRLADDAIEQPPREQVRESAFAAAFVHAVLALAEEVRQAQPPLWQVVNVPSVKNPNPRLAPRP